MTPEEAAFFHAVLASLYVECSGQDKVVRFEEEGLVRLFFYFFVDLQLEVFEHVFADLAPERAQEVVSLEVRVGEVVLFFVAQEVGQAVFVFVGEEHFLGHLDRDFLVFAVAGDEAGRLGDVGALELAFWRDEVYAGCIGGVSVAEEVHLQYVGYHLHLAIGRHLSFDGDVVGVKHPLSAVEFVV